MTTSCAGACCAVFPLTGIDRLRADPSKVADGEYILDMVIPLTLEEAKARMVGLGYGELARDMTGPEGTLFTCRHWSEESRLCTAYEARPGMCRDFPYGRACAAGCSYQVADPQAASQRAADDDDSTWVWEVAANGYRPRSNSEFTWDPEAGLLRPRSA